MYNMINTLYNFFAKYPFVLLIFIVFMAVLLIKRINKVMRAELGEYVSLSLLLSDFGEMFVCILPGVLISLVIAFMISF